MQFQEVLLCTTAPHSPESGPGSVVLHDIQNMATLASFKHTSANNNCTAVFESTNMEGGFILAAQPDKSILNVYNFQKDQIALKIVLPEKLTCIAIDRNGYYCAGGTSQGRIYLWEIASGILFNSWDAHYRRVNVLRFTNDGTVLISGSDDSSVNVWLVPRLVDNEAQAELPTPYCTLSDHTLPITDIRYGVGVALNCRVLTASVDHSVKLWDLSTGSLLTTFQFPQIISHLAWDVTERVFFGATADGFIYCMNLFRERKSDAGDLIQEAVGGGGTSDVIRVDEESQRSQNKGLIQVGEAIASIAISLTSTYLLVGTSNGIIHLYDLPSYQLLRTISTHKGFSITYLTSFLRPLDLIGHVSLNLDIGSMADAKDALPARPVQPFQRIKDSKAREAHEIHMLLHAKSNPYQDDTTEYSQAEFLRDHASFTQSTSTKTGDAAPTGVHSAAASNRLAELEAEVIQLKDQLGKAKGINDAMWDTVVQRLVNNNSEREQGEAMNGGEEGNPRQRKRGRGA